MKVLRYALGQSLHLLIGLVFCSVAGIALIAWTKPPPTAEMPPVYPGVSTSYRSVLPSLHGPGVKVLRYAADDKPEAVLAFYKDALLKDSWDLSTQPQIENSLSFHWGNPLVSQVFFLTVECSVAPALSASTGVEVRVASVER